MRSMEGGWERGKGDGREMRGERKGKVDERGMEGRGRLKGRGG